MKTLEGVIEAYNFTAFEILRVLSYIVSVLSLYIQSTNCMIQVQKYL